MGLAYQELRDIRAKNMKILSLLCMLWIVTSHAASAQSLDIGGIELHIGQKIDDALKSLSAYNVSFQHDQWIVTQDLGNRMQLLGSIAAKDNFITYIVKSVNLRGPGEAPEAYTRANEEVRRRGGEACFTREVKNNGIIDSFITQCGPYELTYYMASKTAEGISINEGVKIYVRKK
jgi:hypothetical protein